MNSPRLRKFLAGMMRRRDVVWLMVWLGGLAILWVWDIVFLNQPAFLQLRTAALNTLVVACCVVLFSFGLGWLCGLALHFSGEARSRVLSLLITFILNLIRSIPQIVGILMGYVMLTLLIHEEILRRQVSQLLWISLVISLFVFLEVADLIRERIDHYRKLDFFDAMLCSGVRQSRIINIEILLKNSRAHLLHKLIQIFGATVFLLCSVDFIVSVGLSTDVSLSNFPPTLGGFLAKMDSKQDILAISTLFSDPSYFPRLLFEHLQGISTAFVIVFTLVCMYNISRAFVKLRRLE